MKKMLKLKVVAFFLAMATLLSIICMPISAEDETVAENTVSDLEPVETEEQIFDRLTADSLMLNYIDETAFRAAGHVSRLPEEEDLNSYVFENEDGTRTAYILAEPVKYVDSTGEIREKNLTLSMGQIGNASVMANGVNTGAYTVTATNTPMIFPNDLSQGVRFTYGEYTITLRPETVNASTTILQADGKVLYRSAFGSTTHLMYTPQLNGLKEDIVLTRYNGQNTFSFILDTDGLLPASDAGGYYLYDETDPDMQIRLGQVVSYDANGDFSIGEMTVEQIGGTSYRVTLTVDENFLQNAFYPVTVDPTLNVIDGEVSSNAIEDIVVFEGRPNATYTSMQYNTVGYADTTLLEGRTAFRLAGIYFHNVFTSPTQYTISSVEFHLWGYNSATQTVTLHPLSGNTTWTESNATWNNIGSHGAAVSSAVVTGNTEAVFDITTLVKGWQNGTYNKNAGFILMGNPLIGKKIYSCENTTTGKRPYAVMRYDYVVTPTIEEGNICVGESKELSVTTVSNAQSVAWTAEPTGIVTFGETDVESGEFSVTVTGATLGEVTVTATVLQADNTENTVVFDPFYVVLEDGVYLIQNGETHLDGDYYLRPDQLPTATNPTPPVYGSTNAYGELENNLFRYWRIQYCGNGKYAIRSLANEDYALSLVNGSVSLSSEISDTSLWIIQSDGTSYKIVHAGSANGDGLVFSVAYPLNGMHNYVFLYQYGVPTVRDYDNMAFENWNLIPATVTGIVFRNEKEGTLCNTFSATADLERGSLGNGSVYISDLGYEILAFSGTNTSAITWSCQQNPGIANINSTTGSITLYHIGTSVLGASITAGDIEHTVSFTLEVILRGVGIQNGATYHIMNASSDRYLSLASESDADATNAVTALRSSADIAKWNVIKQIDGQYKLVNEYSTTDKVLNVSGTNLNILTDSNAGNQIFTIERIDDGSGLYYIMNGSLYVAQDADYNVYLTSTVSDATKWSFMKSDLGQYQLYNFYYLDTSKEPNQTCDTTPYQNQLCIAFEGMGYSYQINKNATAETAYAGLQTSDIFMFIGHGNAGLMAFYNDDGEETGRIKVGNDNSTNTDYLYHISKLPDNSLASLRCVFYLGCKTANTNDNNTPEDTSDDTNLLETTYEKGAHFVLGLTESVCFDSLDDWVEGFEKELDDSTIPLSTIVERADVFAGITKIKIGTDLSGDIIYDWIPHFPEQNIGDANQYLK